MTGKEKCRILREIRTSIAKANGLDWQEEECSHIGPCKGTCPVCDSRIRTLQKALAGKKIVLAAGLAASLTGAAGCSTMGSYPPDNESDIEELTGETDESSETGNNDIEEELTGDVAIERTEIADE